MKSFFFQCLLGCALLAASLRTAAQVASVPAAPSAAQVPAAPPHDTTRTQALTADTRTLRQLDSLRRTTSAHLGQLQQELARVQATQATSQDVARLRQLRQEVAGLRAADSLRHAHARRYIDSLKLHARGYPVVVRQDTLFDVYTKLGPFRPRERAALIAQKVQRLQTDIGEFHPDSLRLTPAEQTTDLTYGEQVIQSISDNDALWMNVPRDSLARFYRARILGAVQHYRDTHSVSNLLKDVGLAALVLVVFYFVVRLVNGGFRWVELRLTEREETWFHGVKLGNYELFTPRRELDAALLLINLLRWTVILLIIYLVLPLLFSLFPGTQHMADTLLGYVLTPLRRMGLAVWHYLPDLVTILVIVTVFRYFLRGINFLKNEIQAGRLTIEGFYPDWANPTYQIIRVLVFAFLLVVIFPYLPGSDSPIFKGVSVFLGFLFTFGSAGSLSNIVAGLVLTYMRAYKLGDRVKIGDVTGDIIEKNLLVTRVRTIKNEEITIPNSTIMSSYTTNYSAAAPTRGLILHTTVTIGYDVAWQQVHKMLLAAAAQVPDLLPDPTPFVLQTSLDDYYVSYQLNAYTREASRQAVLYSLLHQHIQDQFNQAGVEIMSPHYRAVRDGNAPAMPEKGAGE
ncbi:mechanosensitive ion channel [Hymenobacter sp. RP-2-7]|uniref:Mechanosensitive ion channel n=1 Tax=Hymenobacter polaris TaxID=2682546 RepID=A0A7Y0AG52_9BACT|nr:mechanosensitive ion channel domain-containing protein [Hymenobacter polaris]NML66731.1 mechanosensitive ion channel [Hymenobacter polaris]